MGVVAREALGCFLIRKRMLAQYDLRVGFRPGLQRQVTGCTQPDGFGWYRRLQVFSVFVIGVQTYFAIGTVTHLALNGDVRAILPVCFTLLMTFKAIARALENRFAGGQLRYGVRPVVTIFIEGRIG